MSPADQEDEPSSCQGQQTGPAWDVNGRRQGKPRGSLNAAEIQGQALEGGS